MHWLQRANLKTARAWRLKMGLREVFAHARSHNDEATAVIALKRWIGWARRSRLDPSSAWPPRSRSTSTASCAACSTIAPTPSSRP